MDTLFVDTRRSWCMLSSELHSVRSLRRYPSVGREYAAVVLRASVAQQYPYIGSCIDVRRTCTGSFSVVSFTQLKKKYSQKLVFSPTSRTYYWLIASARAAGCYGKVMTSFTRSHERMLYVIPALLYYSNHVINIKTLKRTWC